MRIRSSYAGVSVGSPAFVIAFHVVRSDSWSTPGGD